MNWLTITNDDLKAVALSEIIDAAQTLISPGQPDPAARAIADAVLTVRRAVAAGNVLDTDPTTVPGSLRALTARAAAFALLERMEIDLTADQRATRAADTARLVRIGEERQRVEPADHPSTVDGAVETVVRGNTGHSREDLRGI